MYSNYNYTINVAMIFHLKKFYHFHQIAKLLVLFEHIDYSDKKSNVHLLSIHIHKNFKQT